MGTNTIGRDHMRRYTVNARDYTVNARDLRGNVTVMSEFYELGAAMEDEEILRINNPLMHVWTESSEYWSEEEGLLS